MSGIDPDRAEEIPTPTATLAAEIGAELNALNQLLGKYASKADVTRQLEDERATTNKLVAERDGNRRRAVGGIAFGVMVAVAVSLWALNVSHDAKHAVSVATGVAASAEANATQAKEALVAAKAAEEQQKVVSCNDSNKNRSALVGLFDFIDEAIQQGEAAGQRASQGTKDLVAFGRQQFAPRDCAAEAAARASTTTTQPGG